MLTELYDERGSGQPPTGSRSATPWIAVAILAIFAGAGTATIGPDERAPARARPPTATVQVLGISPRMVELTFNPRVTRGLRVAKVAFRFTFEHAAKDREMVRERIDEKWNAMVSRVLRGLGRWSPDELKLDGGIDVVERDLRATIDTTLFVDGIARTRAIQWEQILVQ